MKGVMDYGHCRKHLREVEIDRNKIKSLMKVSKARVKAIKQIRVDDETASIVTEGYYEAIKELLTALLLKHSLKSDNHECLISFFKEKYSYDYEADMIHRLKYYRNRINYDGIFINKNYLERNILEFEHIISLLIGLIN